MPPRVRRARDPMRREKILEAAKRSFTAHGLKGTSLDAVAAEAGCAKGALYLEFSDKEELLREVVARTFTEIRARFEREVVGIPSPLERLVGTLRFAYRQFAAEPLFAKLMRDDPDLRMLLRAHGDDTAVARAAAAQEAQLIAWIDEGIRLGEIRPDVDREVVPVVIGVLRFAPEHVALATSFSRVSADRALEAIVSLLRAGLAAEVATKPPRAPRSAVARSSTASRTRRKPR